PLPTPPPDRGPAGLSASPSGQGQHDVLGLAVADGAGAFEAALLEEPDGGGVAGERVGVEGAGRLALEEQPQGSGADAAAPEGAAEPVADEAAVLVPPGHDAAGDLAAHGDRLDE